MPYSVRIGLEESPESQTDIAITIVEVKAPPDATILKQQDDPTT